MIDVVHNSYFLERSMQVRMAAAVKMAEDSSLNSIEKYQTG